MATLEKQRLDVALLTLGLVPTRAQATSLVMMGRVWLNGKRHTKAGTTVKLGQDDVFVGERFVPCEERSLEREEGEGLRYVSRGGLKLEKALELFNLNPTGLHCIDAGASTGGFTDCLLQHGASHVYAIDVGYGQLAWRLRQHPQVTVMERTNARTLTPQQCATPIQACVTDVSFISLKKVLPALMGCIAPETESPWVVALIKPQFECLDYFNPSQAKAFDGVIRDEAERQHVVDCLLSDLHQLLPHWQATAIAPSPIQGPAGNVEFISLWQPKPLQTKVTASGNHLEDGLK
jgi:23S rRNA (cytidine1920-2'-O)/16S rRNA (cytidine1409-2'-O)-methyltransferase